MHKVINCCPVCDEKRISFDNIDRKKCSICGLSFVPKEACNHGHYVCYSCEQNNIRQKIIDFCLISDIKNPLELTKQLMKIDNVPMHGPSHHLLIPTALLTSYANTKPDKINLKDSLDIANKRSKSVPGGACGNWGACGAGLGVGIYLSILNDTGPLSTDDWKDVGQLTSHCLNKISEQGGPRCCKRDGFIAITEAMKYSNRELDTNYQIDDISCEFFINNKQCKNIKCPFFPKRA
ncbi:MAG: DUF5714 domain-containing protein [Coprobacillaceae bacterium]